MALLSLCTSIQAEANFTVWVSRRSTGDLYRLNSTAVHERCDPSASYLINEKQCALDEELFNGMYHVGSTYSNNKSDNSDLTCTIIIVIIGCRVAIVPINSTFLIPTASIDSRYSVITSTLFKPSRECVEIFGFNGTNQTLNSGFCQISSLEVHRGREQAIEISHQGFSLGNSGSIEVRR